MNGRMLFAAISAAVLVVTVGYLVHQDTFQAVALASEQVLYVPARPEFGEAEVLLEAQLPEGAKLEQFLANQSDLTPLVADPEAGLVGQLLAGLEGTRNGRRWRLAVRPGWKLQDGSLLGAERLGQALTPELTPLGGQTRILGPMLLELRFPARQAMVPQLLTHWRVPGSGPFVRAGTSLTRFAGFCHGPAGIAGLRVVTGPASRESREWADGLVSRRWAWAVFPGQIVPEDMARIRLAAYDEVRLKDGSVWFLSRRLRRFRPDLEDWSRTRLFGVWKGAMDLPYEP